RRRHRSIRLGARPARHGAGSAARQPLRRGAVGMTPGDREGHGANEQPHWRRDFPIDWPEAQWVARREFVQFLMPVSLACAVGQVWLLWRGWRRASSPAPARIARVSDVPIGGAMLFEYPAGSPSRLMVRVDESTFVAYEQQCTHLTCPVLPA